MELIKPFKINTLCRQFHENLINGNIKYVEEDILNNYKIETLIKVNNKGLISLILQYAILVDNQEIILAVMPYISMKRDFFTLIVANSSNEDYCKKIFINKIDRQTICQKDILFIIENNLHFLLPLLKGLFVELNLEGSIKNDTRFKKYYLNNPMKYQEYFSKKINNELFSDFQHKIKADYNFIIDAGNILFSRDGTFGNHSVDDFKNAIDNFPTSLIIIHQRHIKNKKIKEILSNQLFFATPYGLNDDIFIILAYLKNQVNIVTNDNYKDHTIDESLFRSYLLDNLIKYENIKGKIKYNETRNYSRCIQVIDDVTYIPGNNSFILVK
jgi:hypothetical protein